MSIADRYSIKFANAVKLTLEHEGVFSDHRNDKGGETQYGISSRFLEGINYHKTKITKADAIELYYNQFWVKANCEPLPHGIGLMLFDYAVNSGVKTATKDLQRVLSNEPNINLIVDGIIGYRSLSALSKVKGKYGGYESIVMGLSAKRGEHYFEIMENETQRVFFRGWFRRLAEITKTALEYK